MDSHNCGIQPSQGRRYPMISDDLNAISDRVFELEQENERLREENERLKSKPAPNTAADEFIRLMAPHMAPFEAKYDEINSTLAESMCELVRAYRKCLKGDSNNE